MKNIKKAVKEKVGQALRQRSKVRAAGSSAKSESALKAGNEASKSARSSAVESKERSLGRKNSARVSKALGKSSDLRTKGKVAGAARVTERAAIKSARSVSKIKGKASKAGDRAAAKVDKKTSRKVTRFNRQTERREDRAAKYNKGGKVVAQGADKKDVRRERKQDRVAARAVKKAKRVGDRNFKSDVKSGKLKPVSRKTKSQNTKRAEMGRYTEKGTFDVGVDRESYPVEGKLVTKRKRGDSSVTKFKAKGSKDTPIKKIRDKKKMDYKSGEAIVKKDKKNTKYRIPKY